MKLLNKLEYLQLMQDGAEKIETAVLAAPLLEAVLKYGSETLANVGLKQRELNEKDLSFIYRHGARNFFHLRAWPRKNPDTFLIVITAEDGQSVYGHILIDLLAEYGKPVLYVPEFDFQEEIEPGYLEHVISQLAPEDESPFAILELGDGTYMQTLCTEEGYVLEYQLVNVSSHYEVPELITLEEVQRAMHSYAFGKWEWLEAFDWRKQEL